MESAVEIIRAIINWPLVVCVISVVFIVVMRDRFTEWSFSWKSPKGEVQSQVKAKGIRNLSAPKGRTKLPIASDRDTIEHLRDSVENALSVEGVKQVALNPQAKKVLATLWDGQNRHYAGKGLSEGQWAFRVIPNAYEYGNFILGFAQLLKLGLIGWERKHGQAVLTQQGWEYANGNTEIKEYQDIYRF